MMLNANISLHYLPKALKFFSTLKKSSAVEFGQWSLTFWLWHGLHPVWRYGKVVWPFPSSIIGQDISC